MVILMSISNMVLYISSPNKKVLWHCNKMSTKIKWKKTYFLFIFPTDLKLKKKNIAGGLHFLVSVGNTNSGVTMVTVLDNRGGGIVSHVVYWRSMQLCPFLTFLDLTVLLKAFYFTIYCHNYNLDKSPLHKQSWMTCLHGVYHQYQLHAYPMCGFSQAAPVSVH